MLLFFHIYHLWSLTAVLHSFNAEILSLLFFRELYSCGKSYIATVIWFIFSNITIVTSRLVCSQQPGCDTQWPFLNFGGLSWWIGKRHLNCAINSLTGTDTASALNWINNISSDQHRLASVNISFHLDFHTYYMLVIILAKKIKNSVIFIHSQKIKYYLGIKCDFFLIKTLAAAWILDL